MQSEMLREFGGDANGRGRHFPPLLQRLRSLARRTIVNGLYRTGLLNLLRSIEGSHELLAAPAYALPRLRRSLTSKFGILCYHSVGMEGFPLHSCLAPQVFEAQMRYLRKHYRIVPLSQLCTEVHDGRSVKPTVAITFDDGYRDLYYYAFPVLRKYEIPATIYLIGGCMETGDVPWYDNIFAALDLAPGPKLDVELSSPRQFILSGGPARAAVAWEIVCYLRSIPDSERKKWCKDFENRMQVPQQKLRNRMLNWEQVRTMNHGEISFGSHTMTHPAVSRLELADLYDELHRSKELLERGLDAEIYDFAYPFGKPGDCGVNLDKYLADCGYRSAVTTVEGFNSADANLYSLRRLQIGDDSSMAEFALRMSRNFLNRVEEQRVSSDASCNSLIAKKVQAARARASDGD